MIILTSLSGLASYFRVSEIINLKMFDVEALFVVPYIFQLGKCKASSHCHCKGCQVIKEISPQEDQEKSDQREEKGALV